MLINNRHYITIRIDKKNPKIIRTIDQRLLPHQFKIISLKSSDEIIIAIKNMVVRGAPLIGVAAAYGLYLAALEAKRKFKTEKQINAYIINKSKKLLETRPTAVNIAYAVENSVSLILKHKSIEDKIASALNFASYLSTEESKR